jgi:two-component system OmpR family sensor kinase
MMMGTMTTTKPKPTMTTDAASVAASEDLGDQEVEPQPSLAARIRARLAGDVRSRILAYYFVLLAVALFASTLLIRQALLVRLDDSIAADLRQEAQEFRSLAGGNDPETGEPFQDDVERILEVFLDRNVPGVGEQLIAVPREGQAVFRGAESLDEPLDAGLIEDWRRLAATEEGTIVTPQGEARYLAVPTLADERPLGTFAVAIFLDPRREEVDAAVQIVAVVSGAVLIIASLIAYLAAGRVLAPLSDLRDAARTVSGEDMSRRIEVAGRDEIAQLGQTFNRMLDRLQAAFAIQRSFLRDVSHELRTPIAVVRGHLELLAEGSIPADERAETLELLEGELARMTRFVDELLLLAKAERPDFLQPETVLLDELCDELRAKASALGDRDWRVERSARLAIVADRQRLTQAVMSLAHNAVANTEEGTPISIGSAVEGAWARIWVRDEGAGIPAAEQELVFEPLQRGSGGRRRYEGSGLGLALVKAIAEAHGGHVELRSVEGQGTDVELVMPVEGPGAEGDEPA